MGLVAFKQQLMMQGTPENQANQAIQAQFQEILQQSTVKAYLKYNVNEEQMKIAQKTYSYDKKFNHLSISIQNMYQSLIGNEPQRAEVPSHLTKDVVLNVLKNQCSDSSQIMQDAFKKAASDKNLTMDQFKLEVQRNPEILSSISEETATILSDKQSKALEKLDVTSLEFDSAVQTYSNDPDFSEKLTELFMQAQQAYI